MRNNWVVVTFVAIMLALIGGAGMSLPGHGRATSSSHHVIAIAKAGDYIITITGTVTSRVR